MKITRKDIRTATYTIEMDEDEALMLMQAIMARTGSDFTFEQNQIFDDVAETLSQKIYEGRY